jgi:hypothetical protein
MEQHFPRGPRLSALEKNELKKRALEMVLVLFYIEDLKKFVVESIQATDGLREQNRFPRGPKGLVEKSWKVLVGAGVLTEGESDELQRLIDYRNLVAHHLPALTGDVGRYGSIQLKSAGYDRSALRRVQYFREKIFSGMRQGFVLSLSFRGLRFEAAEQTYLDELKKLERKIRRQAAVARMEIEQANDTIARLRRSGVLKRLEPGHPEQTNRSGQLTAQGITCCRSLFIAGAPPFVVAHLMRISLRLAERQRTRWLALGEPHDGA